MKNKYSFKTDDLGQPTILDKKEKKKAHVLAPVLCLLCAVLVWLYVAGNDAGTTQTFVVPITIENEAALQEETGLQIWFTAKTPTVIVVLRGRSVFLNKVTADNITAVLDAADIKTRGTLSVDVDIRLEGINKSVTVDDKTAQTLTVLADYAADKEIPLSAALLAPSSVSRHLQASVSPQTLTITGPSSLVDTIDAGQVSVYTDVSAGQTLTDRTVTFLDAAGATINHAFLSGVTYTSAVTVTIDGAGE